MDRICGGAAVGGAPPLLPGVSLGSSRGFLFDSPLDSESFVMEVRAGTLGGRSVCGRYALFTLDRL